MSNQQRILLIDDIWAAKRSAEDSVLFSRDDFERLVRRDGFEFSFCTAYDDRTRKYTCGAATDFIDGDPRGFDLILLDIMFGQQGRLGFEILAYLSKALPDTPVIMLSSLEREGEIEQVLAMGAADFVTKPVDRGYFWQVLDRYLTDDLRHRVIGQDPGFLNVVDQAAGVSEGGTSSLLLLGETGSGKESFARYIHRHGPRRDGPFIAVDLNSMPSELVASTIFGHEKGAFTSADRERRGVLEMANGGVLFLDEIGNLGHDVQSMLLRCLEERTTKRIGSEQELPVDIQIISATNVDLGRRVKMNEFRRDLRFRIAQRMISIPPLRERRHDVPLLFTHFHRLSFLERGIDADYVTFDFGDIEVPKNLLDGNVRAVRSITMMAYDLARGAVPGLDKYWAAIALASYGIGDEIEFAEEAGRHSFHQLVSRLKKLDVEAFSVLVALLDLTRDYDNGHPNRARAGFWMTGKPGVHTNVFDRALRRRAEAIGEQVVVDLLEAYDERLRDVIRSILATGG